MNQEVKEIWVKALRSGKYIQGKERLRNVTDNYCCLGVLCDLHREMTDSSIWTRSLSGDFLYGNDGAKSSTVLPGIVMNWAGLNDENPEITIMGTTLAHMNDDGVSFEEIADIIEQEF